MVLHATLNGQSPKSTGYGRIRGPDPAPFNDEGDLQPMAPRPRPILTAALLLALLPAAVRAAAPLQLFIDLTAPGKTLNLMPGTYAGPAVIDKPMVLDGRGEVTIDGGGQGTVLTIEADGVIVRGCRLTGSGNSHDKVDAAVLITADDVTIADNRIDDVLFGVHISAGNRNTVESNSITSRPAPVTLRGDAVRIWYGRGNRIIANDIHDVRDIVLTNSPHNLIRGNKMRDSRMGMELIYSPGTEIADNDLSGNDHGIVGIYSDSLYIHHNHIAHQPNLHGSALAVKGSSQIVMEYNGILDCAVGLTANSPTFPENILYVRHNTFAYNDIAMFFYGEKGGHVIRDNVFAGNFQQVAVTGPTSARGNDWQGNMWQDYRGFDLDGDGFGDTPYALFLYSERVWLDRPMARFFRASPVLEVVDFV